MSQQVPRFLITTEHPGANYDTTVVAFLLSLKNAGLPFNVLVHGDHLERALILSRILGRSVRCISLQMMMPARAIAELSMSLQGAELLVIIGSGLDSDRLNYSLDLELARQLRMSVAIVASEPNISDKYELDDYAYILNSKEQEHPNVLAYVNIADRERLTLPLGVSQAKSISQPKRQFLLSMPNLVELDLNKTRTFAARASRIRVSHEHPPSRRFTRIAVTDDPCFCLCYQNNIELLQYMGAEIQKISPLVDPDLPLNIGAIYITGAVLSEYADDLYANQSFYKSLYNFYSNGGVIYAEAAGLAYLAKQYQFSASRSYQGVGVLPARLRWQPNLGSKLYQTETIEDSIMGFTGEQYTTLLTKDWKINENEQILKISRIMDQTGDSIMDGLSPTSQTFFSQGFIQMASNPKLALNLVQSASVAFKFKSDYDSE